MTRRREGDRHPLRTVAVTVAVLGTGVLVGRLTWRQLGRLAAAARGREVAVDWTVNRPVEEVYRYFRRAESIADLVPEVERVDVVAERGARAHVLGTTGQRLTIPLERSAEHDRTLVAWRAGGRPGVCGVQLRFSPVSGRTATEVHARFWWRPGHGLARQVTGEPEQRLREALSRLEQVMPRPTEPAESRTTGSGRRATAGNRRTSRRSGPKR
ncbi:MAG TPA: SRPBCC family protein [Pseudonocardiaceae bacterium]